MRKRNRLRLCPIIVAVLVFVFDGPSSGRAAGSDPSIVNDHETATTPLSSIHKGATEPVIRKIVLRPMITECAVDWYWQGNKSQCHSVISISRFWSFKWRTSA